MSNSVVLNLAAWAALIPAALVPLRRGGGRDAAFWGVLALAVAGSGLWAATLLAGDWRTGFGATLWVSIAVSMGLFAAIAAVQPQAWRLAPLLVPYLLILGALASVFPAGREAPMVASAPMVWLELHIVVSVVTYGLLTTAAVAALAGFLQERALKTKQPNGLTRMLPAVTESERLSVRLLVLSEAVLGLGLATGMATQYFEIGSLLKFDHKTLLSLLAFVVIGGLLLAHRMVGMRGKLAARFVLLAYLLLTLAYPGVKFVSQMLIR